VDTDQETVRRRQGPARGQPARGQPARRQQVIYRRPDVRSARAGLQPALLRSVARSGHTRAGRGDDNVSGSGRKTSSLPE